MKKILIGLSTVLLLLISGCGEGDSGDSSENKKEPEQTTNTDDQPPALTLTVGGETIPKARTSWSWSFYDEEEGAMAGVEAATDSPPELVDTANPKKVAADAEVLLDFEEAPVKYEIQVWDENNNAISYGGFNLSEHQGITIFEIRAYWEQGSAGYAFALNIE